MSHGLERGDAQLVVMWTGTPGPKRVELLGSAPAESWFLDSRWDDADAFPVLGGGSGDVGEVGGQRSSGARLQAHAVSGAKRDRPLAVELGPVRQPGRREAP
jgi:hypothetical protein